MSSQSLIRVSPEMLRQKANEIQAQLDVLIRIEQDLNSVPIGLPSYDDGNFKTRVIDIAVEGITRLRPLLKKLGNSFEMLNRIADAFEQADLQGLERLSALAMAFKSASEGMVVLLADGFLLDSAVVDEIIELLSLSLFDWTVSASEEARILALLFSSSNLSEVIRQLEERGMLDELLNRVNAGTNRRDLLRLLGANLDDEARALVEPLIINLGRKAELQYNLARLGVDFTAADFDRSAYEYLISNDPGDAFTGVGATGKNARRLQVPLGDMIMLGLNNQETWEKYSNPIGPLNLYLDGLTAEQRQAQVELLLNQPISTVMPEAYGGELPSRAQVIEAAAAAYNLEPELVSSFILAEQRDQSMLEDAAEYVGATAITQGNTSIGLGQVVISTASENDLFSDLLSEETTLKLSHNETAELLASDEFNIFAVAKYIRTVADQGAALDPSTLPYTQTVFADLDLQAYAENSASWPNDNIWALASEYTSAAWDDIISPGWGFFVNEAFQDVINSGVFP
jgi:hypothetical protein